MNKFYIRKSLMKYFILPFLALIALYHIIVTVFGYGFIPNIDQTQISLIRDGLWILFFVIIFFVNIKKFPFKDYFRKFGIIWLLFVILMIFAIGISYFQGQDLYNIVIGIKYGFYYLFIFLSASFIGFASKRKMGNKFWNFLKYFLLIIVIAGFVRQGAKLIRPDFFLNIGYGPLNDFFAGEKPPIYYLTGFEGVLRRQGLFSGPNNYGYFLVLFLPFVLIHGKIGYKSENRKSCHSCAGRNLAESEAPIIDSGSSPEGQGTHSGGQDNTSGYKDTILKTILICLRLLAITMTLSRAAIIGALLVIILVSLPNIKKYKKWFIFGISIVVIGLLVLSIIKGDSTKAHLLARLNSFSDIIDNPLGYGLGQSGPGIHHEGKFLPENYYFQIILDIGTIGLILWAVLMIRITRLLKSFRKNKYVHAFSIGLFTLLIMGLFLHVFEDSMVNYLFFVCFGLYIGYISKPRKG